jgi:hypothetical protein
MKYPLCGCKPLAYSGGSQTAVHTCEGQRDQVLTKDEWTEYLHVTNAIAVAKADAKARHPSRQNVKKVAVVLPMSAELVADDEMRRAFLDAIWQEIGDDGGEL